MKGSDVHFTLPISTEEKSFKRKILIFPIQTQSLKRISKALNKKKTHEREKSTVTTDVPNCGDEAKNETRKKKPVKTSSDNL